jgi:major membrane immunogen (membrane-anchored lipoprotein)
MGIKRRSLIVMLWAIALGFSFSSQASGETTAGLPSEESAVGIWHGAIKYGEESVNVLIHIYDSPEYNQLGYLATSIPVVYQYRVVPVEVADIKNKTAYFESKLIHTRITAELSDDGKGWKGTWRTGQKVYLRDSEMTLERSSTMPGWASNVKHIIYRDGVYEAGHDREPYCKITVKNGRIYDVVYSEKDSGTGIAKDENYGKEYIEEFGELAYPGGQLSVEGSQTYRLQLILSQDVEKVDAVTGATNSLNRFKKAVGEALKGAVLSEK